MGFWIFSPQEVEAFKRYAFLILSAAVGALAGFFVPPTSGELTWANVGKAVAGAVLFSLVKAFGSGRMDAARASAVHDALLHGFNPNDIDDLKSSDVGAVAIRQLWPVGGWPTGGDEPPPPTRVRKPPIPAP